MYPREKIMSGMRNEEDKGAALELSMPQDEMESTDGKGQDGVALTTVRAISVEQWRQIVVIAG